MNRPMSSPFSSSMSASAETVASSCEGSTARRIRSPAATASMIRRVSALRSAGIVCTLGSALGRRTPRGDQVDVLRAEDRGRQHPRGDVGGDLVGLLGLEHDLGAALAGLALDGDHPADDETVVLHVGGRAERVAGGGQVGGQPDAAAHLAEVGQSGPGGVRREHGRDRAHHEEHPDPVGGESQGSAYGGRVLAHPEITACWSTPQRVSVMVMSRTVMAMMLVRIARPVALPTPSGPPLALNPK